MRNFPEHNVEQDRPRNDYLTTRIIRRLMLFNEFTELYGLDAPNSRESFAVMKYVQNARIESKSLTKNKLLIKAFLCYSKSPDAEFERLGSGYYKQGNLF